MITYIKGKFTEITPSFVVVETNGGVAYLISISIATYTVIKDKTEGLIYTHLNIKEDSHTLYGFCSEEERFIFRNLISVNGVGPATAILVLSKLSINEIMQAITTNDVKVLQSVKGVGEKSAQKIIIDLKNKVGKSSILLSDNFSSNYNKNKFESLSALMLLGFSKTASETVLEKIIKSEGPDISVEDLIKKALKAL